MKDGQAYRKTHVESESIMNIEKSNQCTNTDHYLFFAASLIALMRVSECLLPLVGEEFSRYP